MTAFPVPIFVSLLLSFLVVHALLRGNRHPLLLVLISLCAVQSLIIALVQFYGVTALRWVQPVTATLIPPAAWLAFGATVRAPVDWSRERRHIVWPILAIAVIFIAPSALDALVPAVFLLYGVMLLLSTIGDNLPEVRLESGNVPKLLWQVIAISLLGSGCSDVLISMSYVFGVGGWHPLIVTLFSSMTLLTVGVLSLSGELGPRKSRPTRIARLFESKTQADNTSAEDALTMTAVKVLLEEQQLYLDPDLTLARLARKASVPAKTLSAAINRCCGENVSRHINQYRIQAACALLMQGKSVTNTVYECGFNTKSNFNREFLRVMKISPSQWLVLQKSEAEAVLVPQDSASLDNGPKRVDDQAL